MSKNMMNLKLAAAGAILARVAMGGYPPTAPTEPNVHVDAFGSSVFSIRYVR